MNENKKEKNDDSFTKILKLFTNKEKDISYKPEDKNKLLEDILKRKKDLK